MLEDEVLPPNLLHYAEVPTSGKIANLLMYAVLHHKSENKLYRREVMQVWAYHSAPQAAVEPEPGETRFTDKNLAWFAQRLAFHPKPPADDTDISAIIHELSARKLETFPVANSVMATTKHEERLKTILTECANAATLDKHGDKMLHALLKLNLPPRSLAAIASEPPYHELNKHMYEKVNDVVGMWLETPIESIDSKIDLSLNSGESLAIIGGLLEEVLDHTATGIYVNCEILTQSRPSLCALSGINGGIISDTVAVYTPECIILPPPVRPLTSLVLTWARLTPKSELYTALTNPLQLTPGSLLRQWLS